MCMVALVGGEASHVALGSFAVPEVVSIVAGCAMRSLRVLATP
jgi:hypothetical protein